MSESYTPVEGDRVRVVLEGVADDIRYERFRIGGGTLFANIIDPNKDHVVSVEKLEPPVTVFKPGDTVRNKKLHEYIYTVAENGYYDHYAACVFTDGEELFTSRDYELVELVPKPF